MIDKALQAVSFLASHPAYLVRSALNAARSEVSIPMALVRWALDQRPAGKGPERIELFPADPALGLALTVDLYGTKIEVKSEITIESIEPGGDALHLSLHVANLKVNAPPGSPAAMMVSSLDLSRPAALLKMMPAKHAMLVDATDDRFVLDLLQIKGLARNPMLRRILAALSFVRITGVRADGEVLALALDVSPLQAPSALRRAASL